MCLRHSFLTRDPDVTELHNPDVQKKLLRLQGWVKSFVKDLDCSVSAKSLPAPDAVGMTSLSALRRLLYGRAKYG